jgi:hypothetical protein
MKIQHTPGPWALQLLEQGKNDYAGWNSYCIRDGKTNVHLASVGHFDRYFEKQNEANARLMTAAPELLAALENLIETAPGDIECEDNAEKYRSFVLRVACEAVASIQGGAK